MVTDAYYAGWDAQKAGRPHNPRNSTAWKLGYQYARQDTLDRKADVDEDDWMIDPEMEAKG